MGRINRERPGSIVGAMCKLAMLAGALLSGGIGPALAGSADTWDPIALYGGDISFEIRREGEPIGHHWVEFDREGDEIRVTSRAELIVDFSLFDYRFDYQSSDIWRDGHLVSLQATVDDDGDVLNISAWRSGADLVIDGPEGLKDVSSDIFPTNHWNPAVLNSATTLNTLTGEIIPSTFVRLGDEMVETASGPRLATKYLLTLHREVEVWYDRAGHWVRLRFQARDGSTVDYFCLRCGSGQQTESARR